MYAATDNSEMVKVETLNQVVITNPYTVDVLSKHKDNAELMQACDNILEQFCKSFEGLMVKKEEKVLDIDRIVKEAVEARKQRRQIKEHKCKYCPKICKTLGAVETHMRYCKQKQS